MPFLEVSHYTGGVDRRELSKQAPLTIGSHSSNDLQIDEESVDIMHCRVSWTKQGFEAVAAGTMPLDVNGAAMQRSLLKSGDVLRFGTVDVRFLESEDDVRPPPDESAGIGLKPISEEMNQPLRQPSPRPTPPAAPPAPPPVPRKKPPRDEDLDVDPNAFLSALDALAQGSLTELPAGDAAPRQRKSRTLPGGPPRPRSSEAEAPPPEPAAVAVAPPPAPAPPADPSAGLSDRMRQALRSQQRRPGQEDLLRSPLVLGLSISAVVLVLGAAIFYFVGNRNTTQQEFDVARSAHESGNYLVAIQSLGDFIALHPRDSLTPEAQRLLGTAQILQYITGASPKYPEGLAQLRAFIEGQRDLDGFEQLHPQLVDHARTISLGAATAAGRQFDPNLLEISDQARTILETYAPKDAPPTESLAQIQRAYRESGAAILRNGEFKKYLADIDQALSANKPLVALGRRRDLLTRYDSFATDRDIVSRMNRILELEKSLARTRDVDQAALTEDHPQPDNLLALAFRGRTRTDEVAVGKAVLAIGGDSLFGVEFVTGQPLWRRVIGLDSPFFPLTEDNHPSVYLFDSNRQELVRLDQLSGKLLWRQPLGERVTGTPLLTSDALYAATQSGRLLAVDAATGTINATIEFSQPVSGPVELQDGQRLAVAGNEQVIYLLTKRPFAVERIFDLGHAAGSIRAPLLAMAEYLLVIENGDQQATPHLLRVAADGGLGVAARDRIPGRVLDPPVIRGRDLFVPFAGEGVAAFTISDDAGQPPLTRGPAFRGESALAGPVFLLTGPERQLWMATGGLSHLQLTTDSLQPDKPPASIGFATQPLRFLSGYMFHARRRPFSQGTTFTRTDRDTLESDWQAVVGSPILAFNGRQGTGLNLAAVNDNGQVFRLGDRQFSEGPFVSDASERLALHPDLVDPLLAGSVNNGRVAVVCGGPEPRLWVINAAGQIEASPTLPAAPQASPVAIGSEVVVPLAGRLHVMRQSGRSAVQDYLLPTGEDDAWVNLAPAGEADGLGLLRSGTIVQLRLNDASPRNLGEVARVDLKSTVRFPAEARNGLYAVADESQRVTVFESERLEPRGARQFPGGVSGPPRIAGTRVYIEEGQQRLHCVDPAAELPAKWSLDLDRTSVAGVLLRGDAVLVALQSGQVLTVHPETGEVLSRMDAGCRLVDGPRQVENATFVSTLDGSLMRVP